MIECSCRVLTTADFTRAIAAKKEDIEAAGNIKRAVGIVYNAARETKANAGGGLKSCTTCLPSIADHLHQAGLYQEQEYPERSRFQEPKIGKCGRDCNTCPMACPS